MYKFLTFNQQRSELLYDFEESGNSRRLELTNEKTKKVTFVWIC